MRTYSDSQDLRTWMYFCSLNLRTWMDLYTESLPLPLVKRGYHQSRKRMATHADKDVEEEESLFTTDGSKNGYLHYGNEWKCPRKLAIELPYHLDPPLLSLSSTSPQGCCTFMFTATQVARARKWNQPMCPWADKRIMNVKMEFRNSGEMDSVVKY